MTGTDSVARLDTPTGPAHGGDQLKREFTVRSAFALGFAAISPIIALYGVFAIALLAAGTAFWWAFPVVLAGQLLVAAVFGELASRWPFEGSVYQWARHLVGPRYGWFTAWAYMWGLTFVTSTLAVGAAGFLAAAFGWGTLSRFRLALFALLLLALATAANMAGRRVLKVMLYVSMTAELVGSIVIGTILLFFFRVNPFSVLFDGGGTASGVAWLTGPFLLAVAFVGWSFVGFEGAGSIGEEVREPRRALPKAIFFALLAVGALVMYSSLGVVLAIPDLAAVFGGTVADPVAHTMETHLGSAMGKTMLVLLAIGFLAGLLAIQAAVSRCIWASARDRMLPGSGVLTRLSKTERLPRNAIALTAVVAGAMLFINGSNVYILLLSFANAGFYLAFALPVLGAAYVRLRGRWQPGEHSLGRWSALVTYSAAVWLTFETVNISWPRALTDTWYLDWGVLLVAGVLGVAGAVVCWWVFRAAEAAPAGATVVTAEDAV